jgi:hypothetical protein
MAKNQLVGTITMATANPWREIDRDRQKNWTEWMQLVYQDSTLVISHPVFHPVFGPPFTPKTLFSVVSVK